MTNQQRDHLFHHCYFIPFHHCSYLLFLLFLFVQNISASLTESSLLPLLLLFFITVLVKGVLLIVVLVVVVVPSHIVGEAGAALGQAGHHLRQGGLVTT